MAKYTCEASKRVEMPFLKKNGYLFDYPKIGTIEWTSYRKPSGSISILVNSKELYVQFNYTQTPHGSEPEKLDYRVQLVITHCYFGGIRYWFSCPLQLNGQTCNRRVSILYLGRKYFGCRRCHDLAYNSQQESHHGCLSYLKKFLTYDTTLREKHDKIRVKYWKGRPTKRYQRWLNKHDELGRFLGRNQNSSDIYSDFLSM